MAEKKKKINNGILKWIKVGIILSFIWSCCPSIFKPDVGPKVESEAGEPASPKAAAVPIIAMVAIGLKPNWIHSGT